mmetsp:Transcript_61069/g.176951  ORF Transcript_61069/g.176951 Transcript_61069/m.176951 type:complete len:323 (+) Transcript_61069:808-1776(+)
MCLRAPVLRRYAGAAHGHTPHFVLDDAHRHARQIVGGLHRSGLRQPLVRLRVVHPPLAGRLRLGGRAAEVEKLRAAAGVVAVLLRAGGYRDLGRGRLREDEHLPADVATLREYQEQGAGPDAHPHARLAGRLLSSAGLVGRAHRQGDVPPGQCHRPVLVADSGDPAGRLLRHPSGWAHCTVEPPGDGGSRRRRQPRAPARPRRHGALADALVAEPAWLCPQGHLRGDEEWQRRRRQLGLVHEQLAVRRPMGDRRLRLDHPSAHLRRRGESVDGGIEPGASAVRGDFAKVLPVALPPLRHAQRWVQRVRAGLRPRPQLLQGLR